MKPEIKKKLENYWYYYKWHTIVAALLLFFVIVMFVNTVTAKKYDHTIMFLTNTFVPNTLQAENKDELGILAKAISQYVTDINGDGTANVEIYLVSGSQYSTDSFVGARTRFLAELQTGNIMLFITDEVNYQKNCKDGIYELIDTPQGKDYGWNWNGSELQKTKGLERFPEDLYFSVRVISSNIEEIKDIKTKQRNAMELLNNIMNNKRVAP